jgi:hypothetical protein
MSDDNFFPTTVDARVNKFHEATGDEQRINEILWSLDDREILTQRAARLPAEVRRALDAELARREGERRKKR